LFYKAKELLERSSKMGKEDIFTQKLQQCFVASQYDDSLPPRPQES
jgi:hypothetical protein